MNNYNNDYFIMFMPQGDEQIYIKPKRRTAKRKYHYKKLILGQEPLFFENSYREEDHNSWKITNVLVDTAGFLVTDAIYQKLVSFDVCFMQSYPAVYIDDNDNFYENYWYFGFYNELDCLDVDKSDIVHFDFDDEDIDDEDEVRLEVNKYYLNNDILNSINEENRLLFKVAKCSKKYVFVHQKIVDLFEKESGVRFIKVADFEEGRQHL